MSNTFIITIVTIICLNATTACSQIIVNSNQYRNECIDFNLTCVSWNLAELPPKNIIFLNDFKQSDVVMLGTQECENIKPRRVEGRRSKRLRKLQKEQLGKSFAFIVITASYSHDDDDDEFIL
jgi:hypothetical protein